MNGDKHGVIHSSDKGEADIRATDVELAFSRWYGFQPSEQHELYVQTPHCFVIFSQYVTDEERRLIVQMLAEE